MLRLSLHFCFIALSLSLSKNKRLSSLLLQNLVLTQHSSLCQFFIFNVWYPPLDMLSDNGGLKSSKKCLYNTYYKCWIYNFLPVESAFSNLVLTQHSSLCQFIYLSGFSILHWICCLRMEDSNCRKSKCFQFP